jgi:hypothetical protein
MLTPQYFTETVLAGGTATVQIYGRYVSIVSITGSTFSLGLNEDPPQPVTTGLLFDAGTAHFTRLTVINTGGAPGTIALRIAEQPIDDFGSDALAIAMAASLAAIDLDTDNLATIEAHQVNIEASLAAIDLDTDNLATIEAHQVNIEASLAAIEAVTEIPDTPTIFPLGVIAQTGVGVTQLVTAAATNKRVLVQADHDNAGSLYLGFDNTVTAVNSFARLLPGESWQETWAADVYACSQNGTENARAYVLAT